jgi:hypothetical protein
VILNLAVLSSIIAPQTGSLGILLFLTSSGRMFILPIMNSGKKNKNKNKNKKKEGF